MHLNFADEMIYASYLLQCVPKRLVLNFSDNWYRLSDAIYLCLKGKIELIVVRDLFKIILLNDSLWLKLNSFYGCWNIILHEFNVLTHYRQYHLCLFTDLNSSWVLMVFLQSTLQTIPKLIFLLQPNKVWIQKILFAY